MARAGPFTWPGGARAAVSLTFDDSRPSQLDNGLPVLDRHGIRATFYASLPSLRKRARDWRTAARTGHEIGNHSLLHACSGNFTWSRGTRALEAYSLPRMERELRAAGRAITAVVGAAPRTFAYPCGQTHVGIGGRYRSYIPVVSRLFLAGRGFMWETHNHPAYCELANLAAYCSDGIILKQYLARVEAAVADGGWVVFCGHDIGDYHGYQTTRTRELDAFCRRLARRRDVWTAPVAEVAGWLRARRRGV